MLVANNFQLTKQVEEASKQATELEKQLSQRTAEVEELNQQAEAAEKINREPVEQPKRTRRSSEPRRVGSDEQSQGDNGATGEITSNGHGLGGLLKRLFGGSRVVTTGADSPKKPATLAAPVPMGPSESPATGVRSVSMAPPAPPEDEPYKLPRFLSEEPPSD